MSSATAKPPTIDRLLQLVPDSPSAVLEHLSAHPQLAHLSDSFGYSLGHAAASYAQLDLLRTLVNTYSFKIDTRDSDGETPLFAAETVSVARCLVEELRADASLRNDEEETAEEKIDGEGEFPLVAAYLRGALKTDSGNHTETAAADDGKGGEDQLRRPPPLPPGMSLDISTTTKTVGDGDDTGQGEADLEPDPEFRARIEALALRDDFAAESGQEELRDLVRDAVKGLAANSNQRNVREFAAGESSKSGVSESEGVEKKS